MTIDVPSVADLACPLCGYNLRGLTEPRCPECGFRFTWAELRDDQRNRHPYLWEHARGWRELPRRFWTTYRRTCRPRQFWSDVSPAQPVHVVRLLAYWLLTTIAFGLAPVAGLVGRAAVLFQDRYSIRSHMVPVYGGGYQVSRPWGVLEYTAAELEEDLPMPQSPKFWRDVVEPVGSERQDFVEHTVDAAVVVVAWPALSMGALALFAASMRRAKVGYRHVLRVVVYGCDFALLMTVAVGAMAGWIASGYHAWLSERPSHGALPVTLVILACAAVSTHRLGFAYGRYLRFDRPLLTVLSAQTIAVLVAAVALVGLTRLG